MEFLPDILEEHLEEADFLFTQRQNALADHDYDLTELADLEERMLAHLDGLVVAGEAALELLAPLFETGDYGEAFVAGSVTIAGGSPERQKELVQSFGKAKDDTLQGIRAAFELAVPDPEPDELTKMAASADSGVAAAVLDVFSFRRSRLKAGEVGAALAHEDPGIQAAGLRAAGRMGFTSLVSRVVEFLDHADDSLRHEARQAAFVLGDSTLFEICRRELGQDSGRGDNLIWLGLGGDRRDGELLTKRLSVPESAREAIAALGWLGDPAHADALVSCTGEEALAGWAGVAFCSLTGMDPAEAGSPNPDPDRLNSWWEQNRSRIPAGARIRGGNLFGEDALLETLKTGGLLDRHSAAAELARLRPGQELPDTWSLVSRQLGDLRGRA